MKHLSSDATYLISTGMMVGGAFLFGMIIGATWGRFRGWLERVIEEAEERDAKS